MTALHATLALTALHVTRSRDMCRELSALLAATAVTLHRSRELCRAYRGIAGGSDLDSPPIVEVIGRTPLCLGCLARKTGIPAERATEAVARIRAFMQVITREGRCADCLTVTTTYGLTADSDGAAPRPPLRQNDAVWQFLESHRGQMFCTQCIASALRARRRIDRAILTAEGRGARRHYGTCTVCERERLLCGLIR